MFRKTGVITSSLLAILVSTCSGNLPSFAAAEIDSSAKTELSGGVSKTDFAGDLSRQMDALTDEALKRDEKAADIAVLVKKFRSKPHKAKVAAKEALCAVVPYRGFGPSKEGANILLENINKVKSLAAAEYIQQKIEDDLHSKVVQATLQIAMGLDAADAADRTRMISDGQTRLKGLVGDDMASKTVGALTDWSKDLEIPASAYNQPLWDVDKFQENLHDCTQTSVHTDPALHNVVKKIKKYDRSKGAVLASGAVEATITVAALAAPGFFAPAGFELINGAFIAGTGGNEDTKLVNEMYFAKAIESRWRRLHEESQMALQNYQNALRTKSPTLLAASEAVLQQLIGPDRTTKVLGQSVLPASAKNILPIQTAEKISK
jgi:hypothetical protein